MKDIKIQFSTILGALVCLNSFLQVTSVIRNDLRITGGICQTPHEKGCRGLDSRKNISNKLFQKLGRTAHELLNNRWSPLSGALKNFGIGFCNNGRKFNGFQWFDPSEPLSVVILLDIQGTIAGMQFWMPYHEVLAPGQNYKYSEQPMMQNSTTFGGIPYFYITTYFMNPEKICTEGRSSTRLATEGTVSEFFIQNGPSPKDVVQIPMNKESALRNHWELNNCMRYMGHHSFYDQHTWEADGCTSFRPLSILFDNEGELNGFFFAVTGKATARAIERPEPWLTQWVSGKRNSTVDAPKCLKKVHESFGISSLHVFFSERPYDFRCDYKDQVTEVDQPEFGALPICVVGAGISGMEVASLLERKGYNVELYEKKRRVGGKIHTFRNGAELQVEMCPLFLGPTARKLNDYIDKFNLTRVWVNEKDRKGYSIHDMMALDIPKPDINEVRAAVKKYSELVKLYENELTIGYLNATEELFEPLYTWMKKHGIEKGLEGIFTYIMTIEGYGALEEVPALYALQFIGESTLTDLLTNQKPAFFFVKEGLDKFAERLAESLDSKKFLNHQVTRISRKKDHQVIYFGKSGKRKCSKTILAFPPLLPSVQSIVELSEEEENILDKVKVHKYTSAVHRIPDWDDLIYIEWFARRKNDSAIVFSRPEGKGDPVGFIRQANGKLENIYSSYSWIRGDYNTNAKEDDLKLINRKLNASLQKISKNAETFYQVNTEYFPHVNTEALKRGFYKKFDGIQGRQGLYYATTLLSFEVLAKAMDMAESFTNKYF